MERERPLPTGTTTFLFTDVEGSTRLLQQGAEAYAALLAGHHTSVRAIVDAHGGVVVDTQGDAFFASFASAREAVAAATAIRDAHAGGPLQVRIGLHSGEALVAPTGYVGLEVHRAARIAAAGHGGQILVSSATRELVDVPLTDLGSHRLKDLEDQQRMDQLGEDAFRRCGPWRSPRSRWPATQFVGRVRELSELVALLDQPGVRLVTVCGPGGCGKTRIAARAAETLGSSFPDGVVWVDLGAVQLASGVLEQVGRALEARGDVGAAIGTRRLLLVLDNFEQVMDAAADVAALLASCPGLSILVTSREPLHVQAEHQYRLHPLAIDEAVELFLARARARAASVTPDDDLVAVCEQLDRLPLAIELAAARAGVLSVRQLRERPRSGCRS